MRGDFWASNFGPISKELKTAVDKRRAQLGIEAPADLLFASGSGIDPDISVESANYQAKRIARVREFSVSEEHSLQKLIIKTVKMPTFGIFGEPRVNVLRLNIILEEGFSKRKFKEDHDRK